VIPTERHLPYYVPKTEVERRLAELQASLARQDVAAAWIDGIADLFYYAGSAQSATLLVPAQGRPRYVVRMSIERARAESPLAVEPFAGGRALFAAAAELIGASGRLGAAFEITPASLYAKLVECFGASRVADVGPAIRRRRAVKSAWEIEQIHRAAEQATRIFARMPTMARQYETELELSAAIEFELRKMGHPGPIRLRRIGQELAMIVVVAGDSALYPTNFDGPVGGEGPSPAAASGAGWKPMKDGETLMADMVTAHNGYHADDARTWFLGREIPAAVRQAHAFCTDMLAVLESHLKPGVAAGEVHRLTTEWVARQSAPSGLMGFGENQVKFFGHGVGLELDGLPVIAAKQEFILEPGNVIAVEPKAFLPGVGAVGVENTYVITPAGCESLCPTPLEISAI